MTLRRSLYSRPEIVRGQHCTTGCWRSTVPHSMAANGQFAVATGRRRRPGLGCRGRVGRSSCPRLLRLQHSWLSWRSRGWSVLPDICKRCGELGCERCSEPPENGAAKLSGLPEVLHVGRCEARSARFAQQRSGGEGEPRRVGGERRPCDRAARTQPKRFGVRARVERHAVLGVLRVGQVCEPLREFRRRPGHEASPCTTTTFHGSGRWGCARAVVVRALASYWQHVVGRPRAWFSWSSGGPC